MSMSSMMLSNVLPLFGDKSVALLFGNENRGMSDEALQMVDGNYIIPQSGLTKSLNISVACAVSLYEAKRQRISAGMYGNGYNEGDPVQVALFEKYVHHSRPLKGNN